MIVESVTQMRSPRLVLKRVPACVFAKCCEAIQCRRALGVLLCLEGRHIGQPQSSVAADLLCWQVACVDQSNEILTGDVQEVGGVLGRQISSSDMTATG